MASEIFDRIEAAGVKVAAPQDAMPIHGLDIQAILDNMKYARNPMARLLPFMLPIICSILSISLLRWPRQDWSQRFVHLAIWVVCLVLHQLGLPLLSFTFAVGFIVWTWLPGSLKSLNLPDHSQFMRSLGTLPPGDDGEHEECMICWDTKHPLAELSCKHKLCKGCLQLMGQHYQTACPLCHEALFSIHDRKIFAITKTSVALAVVNWTLYILSATKNIQLGEFGMASVAAFVLFSNAVHFWTVSLSIRSSGDSWWRGTPSKEGMQLRYISINLAMNVFNLALTLWNMKDFFD